MELKPFEDLKAELQFWDIESVATEAKVHPSTVWNWTSGRTKKPRLDTTMKVARVVGFRLELVRKNARRLKIVA